jgi:hypothetical protein
VPVFGTAPPLVAAGEREFLAASDRSSQRSLSRYVRNRMHAATLEALGLSIFWRGREDDVGWSLLMLASDLRARAEEVLARAEASTTLMPGKTRGR